ncbi:MAG: hypothetical protein JW741_19930 [Sedimentisphaerales bacterium]|nr:hypothetical protein [Sedimentisphaerales bacterium]
MDSLTADERQILEDAKRRGYYLRSGFRLQPLAEWRRWCRENNRPCIVAIRGARDGRIERDGQLIATVPLAELEEAASHIVERERMESPRRGCEHNRCYAPRGGL